MKLLILGGTKDARQLSQAIHHAQPELCITYSVAGLVRQPQVPAQVISGGFTQHGGLAAYCQAQQIDAVLNATHPFSCHMGQIASQACTQLGLTYWRFLRPQWQQQSADDWRLFDHTSDLLQAMAGYQRIALTLGQVSPEELALLNPNGQIWLRTAVAPKHSLPAQVSWIKAIGPFAEADELALLKKHQIQAIACKNSGGSATQAKLTAARTLGLPVFMLQRRAINGPVEQDFDALVKQVSHWAQLTKGSIHEQ
jgi:precorrin-6A/cobalt-precorrin-6A reductase